MMTQRLESMSPMGFLRLYRQEDGDIVIAVCGEWGDCASVEFCTPGAGRGGSQHTYAALIQLMGAMAKDCLDPLQAGRTPEDLPEESQQKIIEWASESRQAVEDAENQFGE